METSSEAKNEPIFPIDKNFLNRSQEKLLQIQTLANSQKNKFNLKVFHPQFSDLVTRIKQLCDVIDKNLNFLNSTEPFKEDFINSIQAIDKAFDSYLLFLNYHQNNSNSELFSHFKNDFDNFLRAVLVFSSNFLEIMNLISNQQPNPIQYNRFGIELALFCFSVNVFPMEDVPYYKSHFISVYPLYNDICAMKNNTVFLESVCGSGKTLFIPIVLISLSLKNNMNVPYLLLSEPTPKHVEPKEAFFNKRFGKYLIITHDMEQLTELYKRKQEKIVFGLLTPHDLLPFMYQQRQFSLFYQLTRIILDDIHQRTFHLDVLLAQFGKFNRMKTIFTHPLHLTLMSATIDRSLLKVLGDENTVQIATLLSNPNFEIVSRPPIIETNVNKISFDIVPNETFKVINEMANINSKIGEGHILVFLPGIGTCYRLQSSVHRVFRRTEETSTQRKIVVLQTALKQNESLESFFRRLQNEYELIQHLREPTKQPYLYILPLVLSGVVEETIYELAQNELPGKLKSINKLICSTPMIESSFTIDRLSVVIDSGLYKEAEFDIKTGLTTFTEKQTSLQSMEQRKGRLGRTMKGLYISICSPRNQILPVQTPPIVRTDLSTNVLLMKDIEIDFDKVSYLPTPPNAANLHFAFETLKGMGAIYNDSEKITQKGHEFLKYPFKSIYYGAAVIYLKDSFKPELRPMAEFLGAYLASIISLSSILIDDWMMEKMSEVFDENSDIITIYNALNILFRSEVQNDDEMRMLVESYGFSYFNYLTLKSQLEEIIRIVFPNENFTIPIALNKMERALYDTKLNIFIDRLIDEICSVYPEWKKTHYVKFKYMTGSGDFNSSPTLVFNGDPSLKFPGQKSRNSEIKILRRPGWNGIKIPTECFCFTITRNMNNHTNMGNLIHKYTDRSNPQNGSAIMSIELEKNALNPWFQVLLELYLKNQNLQVHSFTNKIRNGNQTKMENKLFYFSNIGERVFLSFMPMNAHAKDIIVDAVHKCLQVLPFSPRSVLINAPMVNHIIEVMSVGTQHYETYLHQNLKGCLLNARLIDYCIRNIKDLALSQPKNRICAIFTTQECSLENFDQKRLFLISTDNNAPNLYPMSEIIRSINEEMMYERRQMQQDNLYLASDKTEFMNQLKIFQFPAKFIHPALVYHQESRDKILSWFKRCPYAQYEKVMGHRFLISQSGVMALKSHLKHDPERIKEEIGLNYVAIPIASYIYAKISPIIKSNPTWIYNTQFRTLLVPNEQFEEVQTLIHTHSTDNDNNLSKEDQVADTLCCCYMCDDPDNPVLTNYPITVYYQNGTSYTSKACRDCICIALRNAVESYFQDGKINQDALLDITFKPSIIPSIESKDVIGFNGEIESWPQIPLGQMISTLINNDDDMAELITAWLRGISEFSLRVQGREKFTFCPLHRHILFSTEDSNIACPVKGCPKVYCGACEQWHQNTYVCPNKQKGLFKRSEKLVHSLKHCPRCKVPTIKEIGCNHITCPCGCHWCYVCMAGFTNATKCYDHLLAVHGGCFDYHFDD